MKRALAFLAGAAALAFACRSVSTSSSSGAPNAGSFDKPKLLAAFGECATGLYKDFQSKSASLAAATAKADDEPSAENAKKAQDAWLAAIDAWEEAEGFILGPAAAAGAPGGQDLRDAIYAWPLVNRCLVDQAIVAKDYDKPEWKSSLVSVRGLGASEYLLFHPEADNGCAASVSINAQGSWAAIGADDLARRKMRYARVAAADVDARARALVDAWDPAKGNFLAELTNAGRGSKTFATDQAAFNAASDALFFVELSVKEKVSKPLGVIACGVPNCLDTVESPWARRSKEHVRANLRGFRRMFAGCGEGGAGLGFDDLLRAVGAEKVAAQMQTELDAAFAAIDALGPATLEDTIQKEPAKARAIYDALKRLADILKSDFVTVLALEVPKRVDGDND